MKGQVTLDETVTREQLIAIAREYRPRIRGMSRYFPHQGSREQAKRLKRMGVDHAQADAVRARSD